MSETRKPWHGVIVATSLPFDDDLAVDLGAFGESVAWLAEQGLHGVAPNGSLGEYQTLTDEERDRVVETAVAHAPDGFTVMPGVGAYGAREAVRHARFAKDAGCQAVMCLPPNAYRADDRAVLEHFEQVASVGLPVTAYNNPIDTKVDLRPELLAKLHAEGFIVGVKEFSGDVRRCYEISELAPGLDLMIGTDDTVLEVGIAGAKGWVAGYPQVFPRACLALYEASVSGDLQTALPLYRELHPVLRWDSKTEFVQAIKLGQDMIGRRGGRCRPPRQPLAPETEAVVRAATQALVDAGVR
ncbi:MULTISPECIES: dihydrodipicolinate synthase family protein [Streptomyces]|uniref:Dihydrodipicolinate synthase n=2 Tax=Streptomyces TaxID=1883 RepID=A0A1Y2P3R7_STRFR|nr:MULTISPECIES: dihydrodipicolinate synthase family protein [Streptomyces]AOT57386.1 putative DapA-like lyase [Streptomyces rubrolavendulae]KAF0648148.1 dihydrodipicolinate synthase [Streptomyces fradiae ATCC 10745 = DSM 40063]OSY53879.1 putative DapA-like lyase [Streptomyces fradiae ATCC 10745 = DSM 40063]QEV10820.1 dihydrodipicolinate synthase family protein [Streptomyces fradiae ATCC 10745 = DSM 40063]